MVDESESESTKVIDGSERDNCGGSETDFEILPTESQYFDFPECSENNLDYTDFWVCYESQENSELNYWDWESDYVSCCIDWEFVDATEKWEIKF